MNEDKLKEILKLAFKAAQEHRDAITTESVNYFKGQQDAYLKVLDIIHDTRQNMKKNGEDINGFQEET